MRQPRRAGVDDSCDMHCRHRAGAGAAGGSGPEPGANGDAGRGWREVQHVAGFRHRTCEPTRQDRLLCRADVRQPRPARGLERAGSPAPVAGHRQGRRLRVGKDHHRQSQKLPGSVVRRPGHVWVVRARAEGSGSLLDAAAGGTRGQSGIGRPAFSRWRTRTTTTWRIRWRSWAWRAESRSTVRTPFGAAPMAGWP